MPVQWQPMDVPFATGLQQKTDPRLVQVGAQTSLVNGVVDKLGTIRKRPGTQSLASTVVSPAGNTLAAVQYRQRVFRNVLGGLAMLSGRRYWAYARSFGAWSDLDDVRAIVAKRYSLATPGGTISSYDIGASAAYPQHAAVVYCESGSVKLLLVDTTDNSVVYGPIAVGAGDEARVCIVSDKAMIAYQSSAAIATINAVAFDFATWTLSGAVAIVANCGFRGLFDVATMNGITGVWTIAYITNSGANAGNVSVKLVNTVPAVTATQVYAGTTGGGGFTQGRGVAVHATSGEQIWVSNAYDDGANTYVRTRGLNPTTLATTTADGLSWQEVATQYVRLGIERQTATACVVCGSLYSATTAFWVSPYSTAGASGIQSQTRGYGIASKPFTLDGKIYANIVQTSLPSGITQSSYFTADLTDGYAGPLPGVVPVRPVATIGPRLVSPNQNSLFVTSSTGLVSATRALAIGSVERTSSGGTGLDLLEMTNAYDANQTAQIGDTVYCASGTPQELDGIAAVEMGFLHDPRSASAAAIAGGGLAVGTYFYAVVFEYRDDKGQRSQSAPIFPPSATTAAANLQIQLTIGCLHLTQRQNTSRVRTVGVAIYRTTVGGGGGATGIYYRVFTGALPAAVQSSVTAASVTYTDNASDAQIQTNERLDLARLNPVCPSSLSCLIAHNGRLAGIGDDGVSIWLTTAFDGGTTVPYFADELVQYMPDGGRCTALASMDGQLVVFRRDAIFLIAGDGPDASGQQGGFSTPRKLATDVGCTGDWRGVVVTPQGIVYQNGTRLYLLTRSLEVQYLSAPVEDILSVYVKVTSAVVHSSRDEVRFTLQLADAQTTGYVVNWNYVTGAWSLFDYYDTKAAAVHAAWEHSCVFDGAWYGAQRSGGVVQEVLGGNYLDDAAWVTLSVTSAWLRPGGAQGFARFRRAALAFEALDPADVTISVGYDDSDAFDESQTKTAAEIAADTTPKAQTQFMWARQKAMSCRVKISDAQAASSASGQGPLLYALAVDVGQKGSINRMPEVQ